MTKATNIKINHNFLKNRVSRQFGKQKWIEFCEVMLDKGFTITLYEARQTVSKYITVNNGHGKTFKVRFSNHAPIKYRELNDDCDYFVGRTHTGTRTTQMAIARVLSYFAKQMPAQPFNVDNTEDDFDIVDAADNDDKAPWED